MNEESQVRGCYNITFICTNQETVCWKRHKQTKHLEHASVNAARSHSGGDDSRVSK